MLTRCPVPCQLQGVATSGDAALLFSRLVIARGHIFAAVFEGHISPSAAEYCRSHCWDAFVQASASRQQTPVAAAVSAVAISAHIPPRHLTLGLGVFLECNTRRVSSIEGTLPTALSGWVCGSWLVAALRFLRPGSTCSNKISLTISRIGSSHAGPLPSHGTRAGR